MKSASHWNGCQRGTCKRLPAHSAFVRPNGPGVIPWSTRLLPKLRTREGTVAYGTARTSINRRQGGYWLGSAASARRFVQLPLRQSALMQQRRPKEQRGERADQGKRLLGRKILQAQLRVWRPDALEHGAGLRIGGRRDRCVDQKLRSQPLPQRGAGRSQLREARVHCVIMGAGDDDDILLRVDPRSE